MCGEEQASELGFGHPHILPAPRGKSTNLTVGPPFGSEEP